MGEHENQEREELPERKKLVIGLGALSVFVWSAVFRDRVEMHVSGAASAPGLCGIDSVSE